jgi:hypothetical protein
MNKIRQAWLWQTQPLGPFSSGDIAKNFKNELNKGPNHFAGLKLPSSAVFLVRECLQNSLDARNDKIFANYWATKGIRELPPLSVTFRFVTLKGPALDDFLVALDYSSLADRSEFIAKGERPFLPSRSTISELRLLYIEEQGASGMYGPWSTGSKGSKMITALMTHNVGQQSETAGGAFGHGKSAIAKASLSRINIAYTSFPNQLANSGVSRRLLGIAYWPHHQAESIDYTGWGFFTSSADNSKPTPTDDSVADSLANSLGFTTRSSNSPLECGTSMLIVEPAMSPANLEAAVAQFWWPAILQGKLTVQIVEDGIARGVDPEKYLSLQTFCKAYKALGDEAVESHALDLDVCDLAPVPGSKQIPGRLSLVPIPTVDKNDQKSIVAFTRRLGMVVQYAEYSYGPPYVHGVFESASDGQTESLLRAAEPKAHDRWITEPDIEDSMMRANVRRLVQSIFRDSKKRVNEFVERLNPQSSQATRTFDEINNLIRNLVRMPRNDGQSSAQNTSGKSSTGIQTKVLSETIDNEGREVRIEVTRQRKDTVGQIRVLFHVLDDHRGQREISATVRLVLPEGESDALLVTVGVNPIVLVARVPCPAGLLGQWSVDFVSSYSAKKATV